MAYAVEICRKRDSIVAVACSYVWSRNAGGSRTSPYGRVSHESTSWKLEARNPHCSTGAAAAKHTKRIGIGACQPDDNEPA
jgi:hypothetical protein